MPAAPRPAAAADACWGPLQPAARVAGDLRGQKWEDRVGVQVQAAWTT